MNNYTHIVKDVINTFSENEIIAANILYNEKLNFIPETAFYKILQRMVENKELIHITKGVYARTKNSDYGIIPISENDIINYYTKNNSGICIGYYLYNKIGLTTQTPSSIQILSNLIIEEKKKVNNVEIHKINFELTPDRIEIIKVMELMQNYNFIEDANPCVLYDIVNKFSTTYNEEEVMFILNNLKYKKSTISSLERFLNHFSVENNLNKYLSALSNYKNLNVEKIYESTLL